ncbi:30S ribosomal protein S16 [Striga asiatica]|uniref:30S ribosomal protein S16 n=1 Tax=Striga asiatica TaxID=4170 RepID=A0A5A7Q3K8_STRAF|nr:30S ribosomal protein S16 [Striga asiatica]
MGKIFSVALAALAAICGGRSLRRFNHGLAYREARSDRSGASGEARGAWTRILPISLRNVKVESLINDGQKGLVLGTHQLENDLDYLKGAGIELLSEADSPKDGQARAFDFLLVPIFGKCPLRTGLSGTMVEWFDGNYPTHGQEFTVYNMEEMEVRMEDYVVS